MRATIAGLCVAALLLTGCDPASAPAPPEPDGPGSAIMQIESEYGVPDIAIFHYHVLAYSSEEHRRVLLAIYEDGVIVWSETGDPPFKVAEVAGSAVDRVIDELRRSGAIDAVTRFPTGVVSYSYPVIVINWGDTAIRVTHDLPNDDEPRFGEAWAEIKNNLLSLIPENRGREDDSLAFEFVSVPVSHEGPIGESGR